MSTPALPTKEENLTRGYFAALGTTIFLSTTAIFIRYLTLNFQIPPLLLAAWRGLLVTVTLFCLFALFRPARLRLRHRHDLTFYFRYGVTLALFNSFWTISVAINGAAIATVLAYSSAIFTVLLAYWYFDEPITGAKWLVMGAALAGCVLVAEALNADAWLANPFGLLVGVCTGLGYSLYSLAGRAAGKRDLDPWTSLFYTFVFGTVIMLGLNFVPGVQLPGALPSAGKFFWFGDALDGWVILLILAAVPTLLGFGLYNISLLHLPAGVANLMLTTEPVFTATWAYFLLGERLSPLQLVGAGLIIGAVLYLRWVNGRRPTLPTN